MNKLIKLYIRFLLSSGSDAGAGKGFFYFFIRWKSFSLSNKILFSLFLFLFTGSYLVAQTVNRLEIRSSLKDHLAVCGAADTFFIELNNTSPDTLTNITVTVTLPPGIIYSGSLSANAVEKNVLNSNAPEFSLSGRLLPSSKTVISFTGYAGCNVIPHIESGNIIANTIKVDYDIHSASYTEQAGSDSYPLLYADLAISGINRQTAYANVGDTIERIITIVNGGNGPVSGFILTDEHTSSLQLLSTDKGIVTHSVSADTIKLDSPLGSGQSISITQQLKVLQCDSLDSKLTVSWGCNNTLCRKYTDYAKVLINVGKPRISISRHHYDGANYCGRDGSVMFKYTNSGKELAAEAGIATNLKITFDRTINISELQYMVIGSNAAGPLTSVFLIQGLDITQDAAGRWVIDLSTLRIDPDGVGGIDDLDGDGNYDDLAVGSSFYIKLKIHLNCDPAFAHECPLDYSHLYVAPQAVYSDQCGIKTYLSDSPHIEAATHHCQSTQYGSPDLDNGQEATYRFCLEGSMTGDLYCPEGKFITYFAIPKGIKPILTSPVTFNNTVVTAQLNAAQDTLILTGGGVDGCYSLKFKMDDCAGAGTQTEKEYSINWEAQYRCAPGCACIQRLARNTITIIGNRSSCPNISLPNNSLRTTSISVKRTSLGWKSPDLGSKIDANNTTRLNAAYACDNFKVAAKGIVVKGTASQPHVEIIYTLPGTTNFIQFLDAQFIVPGKSPCNALLKSLVPSSNSDGTTTYTLEFEVPSSCKGGALTAGQEVTLTANFKMNDSPSWPVNTYQVPRFRARHYNLSGSSAGTSKVSTGSKGCEFELLKPSHGFHTGATSSQCAPVPVTLSWGYSDCEGDNFPGEFRHLIKVKDSIEVIIPGDYNYIPNTAKYVVPSTGGFAGASESPAKEIFINDTTILFISDANGWPLMDKGGDHDALRFTLSLQPTCNSPDQGQVIFKYKWIDKAYADDPGCKVTRSGKLIHTIINEKPELTAEPTLHTFIGGADTVAFDFRLANHSFETASENTWLAFENSSGNFEFLYIEDVETAAKIPFITYGTGSSGNAWIKLNRLNGIDQRLLRLVAKYKQCTYDSINVLASWDCTQYPGAPGSAACTIVRSKAYFEPKEARMQARLITPGNSLNLCTPTTYEIEVKSSSIGHLFQPAVKFSLSPNMKYSNGSARILYPATGSYVAISDPQPDGDEYMWDISSLQSEINAKGLTGVNDLSKHKVTIRFDVLAECDALVSSNSIGVSASATTNCGNPVEQNFGSSNQRVQLPPPAYTYRHVLIAPDFRRCNDTTLLDVRVINAGTATTSSADTIFVDLPAGITQFFDLTGIHNAPPDINPVQQSIGGGRIRLVWKATPNISPGDSIHFTFRVTSGSALNCSLKLFGLNTSHMDTVRCPSNNNEICLTRRIYEGVDKPVQVRKPSLVLSNLTAPPDLFCNAGSYNVTVNIKNYGDAVLQGDTTIVDFYCDTNDDESYTPGIDVLLGSHEIYNNIASGETISISAAIPGNCSRNKALLAVIDPSKQCICSMSQTKYIPLKASFTANSVCLGNQVCITNTSVTSSATTYTWDFGDPGLNASTENNPCILYDTPGVKTITMIATDACGSDTVVKTVTIYELPVADAGNDPVICPGESVQIGGGPTASAGTAGYTYLWSPSKGLDNTSIANPTATPSGTTTYTVLVTDQKGCKATAETTVYIILVKTQ